MDREDLYDFFRLHTYRALARTYLREFNPELEADALQILSDLDRKEGDGKECRGGKRLRAG